MSDDIKGSLPLIIGRLNLWAEHFSKFRTGYERNDPNEVDKFLVRGITAFRIMASLLEKEMKILEKEAYDKGYNEGWKNCEDMER